MAVYDISRTLNPALAPWPGDTAFRLEPMLERRRGASVNLTTLTISAHFGTHMDAPHHFTDGAATVEGLDLAVYWGRAQVVTVEQTEGPLLPGAFARVDLSLAPRLLVHSRASHLDPTRFPASYVYPDPSLAGHLAAAGVILYGADAPSMDHAESKTLPGHNALLAAGVAILEGLDLSRVPDGLYELVALPLKIEGGDGSPVRAALRTL